MFFTLRPPRNSLTSCNVKHLTTSWIHPNGITEDQLRGIIYIRDNHFGLRRRMSTTEPIFALRQLRLFKVYLETTILVLPNCRATSHHCPSTHTVGARTRLARRRQLTSFPKLTKHEFKGILYIGWMEAKKDMGILNMMGNKNMGCSE